MSLCALRSANLKWFLAHPLSLTLLFAGFLRVRPKGSNKIDSAESSFICVILCLNSAFRVFGSLSFEHGNIWVIRCSFGTLSCSRMSLGLLAACFNLWQLLWILIELDTRLGWFFLCVFFFFSRLSLNHAFRLIGIAWDELTPQTLDSSVLIRSETPVFVSGVVISGSCARALFLSWRGAGTRGC